MRCRRPVSRGTRPRSPRPPRIPAAVRQVAGVAPALAPGRRAVTRSLVRTTGSTNTTSANNIAA